MFGRKNKTETVDTVIGSKVEIHGKIFSETSLRVEGKVIGDIEAKGRVIVGNTGYIEGNVICKKLTLIGKIYGNVISYENVEIMSTGRLEGDLKYSGKFSIEEGGIFLGRSELLEKGIGSEEEKL
jgi:cytoskeletal protein CcmA (bactofilin family)